VWEIKERCDISSKNPVEMFNVYLQKAYFKKFQNFQFILNTFPFWSQICLRNSSFSSCGAMSWRGRPRLHTIPHHCTATLHQTPLVEHTRHFCCIKFTDRDIPTFVGCYSGLPTCAVVGNVSFTWVSRESLYEISLPRQGYNN